MKPSPHWCTTDHAYQPKPLLCVAPPTKVAVVRTLMSRANTLSFSGVQQVEKKIADALKENGYTSSSFASTRVQLGIDRKWMSGDLEKL